MINLNTVAERNIQTPQLGGASGGLSGTVRQRRNEMIPPIIEEDSVDSSTTLGGGVNLNLMVKNGVDDSHDCSSEVPSIGGRNSMTET